MFPRSQRNGEQYLIRAPGQVLTLEDIGLITVGTFDGVPVHLHDVAEIGIGTELRTGAATAEGKETVLATVFMLVISLLYALMYFVTAGILHAQKGEEHASPLDRSDGVLQTWTGPMDRHTVAAQILAVPAGFAFLGVTFFVIRATAGF